MQLFSQISDILDDSIHKLSNIKPSEWAEKHRVMSTENSPRPGKFSFQYTPYLREVLDTLSPDHPARKIAVMKGAQIGFSTGVIENGIGFIIAESPGNTMLLTGHADLAEEAMSGKIDGMIDSCGLRPLIRPNVLRKKNQRTGDTNKSKEFPGGSLIAGSASNHKLHRQRSIRYGFIDDFDAAKNSDKQSGSTMDMINGRFAAYADKKKIYYISTPEVKQTSNIEPAYLMGDQRRYYVPCPCCGDYIYLEWSIDVEGDTCGIVYELDDENTLIEDSVGYKCQSCKEIFTDRHKYEMNLHGEWRPTVEPEEPGFYSYHISALYSPPGMTSWEGYVRQYLQAYPPGGEPIETKAQTFQNIVLGHTYEQKGEAPKSNMLQGNIRAYEVGEVPDKVCEMDGNGDIILLTCACDLNGKIDDARLDYEIVAWSSTGANYSVCHGSIGTFIPNQTQAQKDRTDRKKWTYMVNEPFNVWDEFLEILKQDYVTQKGRRMGIMVTGVDTGNTYGGNAYAFVDKCKNEGVYLIGLKGKTKKRTLGLDTPTIKVSRERGDLYLVEVNQVKDDLAAKMKLKWNKHDGIDQPAWFINFPTPSDGLYLYKNFFSHYESEHRVVHSDANGKGVSMIWEKKTGNSQNHLWDCRVYNMALKDFIAATFCKQAGVNPWSWADFAGFFNQ